MGSLGLTVSQEAVTSFITWDGATASGTREPTLTCEPPLTCCGSLWKAGGRAGVATLVFRDCTFPASPTRSGLPFWGPSPWPRQLRPHKEAEAGREAASARGWGAGIRTGSTGSQISTWPSAALCRVGLSGVSGSRSAPRPVAARWDQRLPR